MRTLILWISNAVFEAPGLEGGGQQCSTVLDGERRRSGARRHRDRLRGGWKVGNESGEILRSLKESEHVMCLTETLHGMTTLAAWAAAERSPGGGGADAA